MVPAWTHEELRQRERELRRSVERRRRERNDDPAPPPSPRRPLPR